MSKYSKAFKLKIIKQCLTGISSPKRLAIIHGIHHSNIQQWVNAYRAHGSKTINRGYARYSKAFKLTVLSAMKQHSLSLHQAAAQFDIAAPSTIFIWQKLYTQGGSAALDPRPRGRTAMPGKLKPFKPTNKPVEEMTQAELMREVQYRRAETAYLKKLEAVLQARESTAKPKPK